MPVILDTKLMDGIKMITQNNINYKIREDAGAKNPSGALEKYQDKQFTRDIGRSMRFFLNLSFALIIAFPVFVIFDPRWLTSMGVMVFTIPIIITIIFFLAFLRLLKQIEKYAVKKRNIELVSSISWEFNKSSLIRLAIGKIQTFMDEE